MNGSIKKIISLILLISCANTNAFIYLAQKYVKILDTGRVQTLWLLSDKHSDDPATDLQVKIMLDFAQQLKNKGYTVKFIVEDGEYRNPTSLPTLINQLYGKLYLRIPFTKYNSPTIITNACKQRNFDVCNIEFRWNENDLLNALPFAQQAYDQYLAAQQKIIQEIRSYNDNEALNAFYTSVVQEKEKSCQSNSDYVEFLNKQIKPLSLLKNPKFYNNILYVSLVINMGSSFFIKKRVGTLLFLISLISVLGSSYTCDTIRDDLTSLYNQRSSNLRSAVDQSKLIDPRVLHQIYASPDQDHIFVLTGGWHAQMIIPILLKIDYKLAGAISAECKIDYNAVDALSRKTYNFGTMPENPVSPAALQSFFDFYHPIPELLKNRKFQNPRSFSTPVCLPRVQ